MADSPAATLDDISTTRIGGSQAQQAWLPSLLASPPGTPISGIPAKARMRLNSPASDINEVSHPSLSQGPHGAQPDSITTYPIVGQPVMDTTLKEMLMLLRSSLQVDMLSLLHKFVNNISFLEDRVSNVETHLGDVITKVKDLIDAHNNHAK